MLLAADEPASVHPYEHRSRPARYGGRGVNIEPLPGMLSVLAVRSSARVRCLRGRVHALIQGHALTEDVRPHSRTHGRDGAAHACILAHATPSASEARIVAVTSGTLRSAPPAAASWAPSSPKHRRPRRS